jgi:hypothetical protein
MSRTSSKKARHSGTCKYHSYSDPHEDGEQRVAMPVEINSMDFSYDDGRLSVHINGIEVYRNGMASHDFNVTITREKEVQ